MATRQRKKSVWTRFVMPVITIAFLTYFGYHSFVGDYGVLGRIRFERQAVQLQAELTDLRQRRKKLERKVVLLRPQSLDPDMIDERARVNLNLVHRNEITIFLAPDGTVENN